MLNKESLITKLIKFNIEFEVHEHEAFFTVNDSVKKRSSINGSHTKNLFFKNKKNQFFLFSCAENTQIDIKKLGKSLGIGNISFANKEYLNKYLGVYPGAVSPFGLLNDNENVVNFYLDINLKKFNRVNFHPLVNTSTINLDYNSFIYFLIKNNKNLNFFDFNKYSLIV